jgi:Protein of unknown function (DUF4089)
MTPEEAAAYVEATARMQGFALTPDQLARVMAVFARNAAIAALVMDFDLPEAAEPAPQFRP